MKGTWVFSLNLYREWFLFGLLSDYKISCRNFLCLPGLIEIVFPSCFIRCTSSALMRITTVHGLAGPACKYRWGKR